MILPYNKPLVITFPEVESIRIIPIFDVHIGAKEFAEKDFVNMINYYKDDPNTYFILGGDICNNSIKSSVANPFDEVMRPKEQKKYACKLLEPIKDKILCAVTGNHELRSSKEVDDDIMYDICSKLDIEEKYREDIAFLILRMPRREPTRKACKEHLNYTMAVTHGSGGGMYIGSSANKLERFGGIVDGLDILVTGHTHKPITFPSSRLRIDTRTKTVNIEQFTAVQASSWLEWGGYSARKMLIPTARVHQELILDGKERNVKVIQY